MELNVFKNTIRRTRKFPGLLEQKHNKTTAVFIKELQSGSLWKYFARRKFNEIHPRKHRGSGKLKFLDPNTRSSSTIKQAQINWKNILMVAVSLGLYFLLSP